MSTEWKPTSKCPLWTWKRRFDYDYQAHAELLRLRSTTTLRHPDVTIFKCQSSVCGGFHIGQPWGASLEKK